MTSHYEIANAFERMGLRVVCDDADSAVFAPAVDERIATISGDADATITWEVCATDRFDHGVVIGGIRISNLDADSSAEEELVGRKVRIA